MDSKHANKYVMAQIRNFNARLGYRRCLLPGVGVWTDGHATADLWRTRGGNVVVRFQSLSYRVSFAALLASGDTISDAELEEFGDYLTELLLLWLSEGVDDTPTTEL